MLAEAAFGEVSLVLLVFLTVFFYGFFYEVAIDFALAAWVNLRGHSESSCPSEAFINGLSGIG
jgi:hypothetical protein